MNRLPAQIGCAVAVLAILALWQMTSRAQSKTEVEPLRAAKADEKFQFDVLESFDAKYLGDTPGHIGRSGGLGNVRPNIALGDPVFRGDQKVGSVTLAQWERIKGSLTIEFDPEPFVHVGVGDSVWVSLNSSNSKEKGKQ